jgi:hypothetical protein
MLTIFSTCPHYITAVAPRSRPGCRQDNVAVTAAVAVDAAWLSLTPCCHGHLRRNVAVATSAAAVAAAAVNATVAAVALLATR